MVKIATASASECHRLAHRSIAAPAVVRRQRLAGGAAPSGAAVGWRSCSRSSPIPHRRRRVSSPPAAAVSPAEAADDPETEFDWKLGLALAGCAFEAYNGIESEGEEEGAAAGGGRLRMVAMGGTEVSFVNKDFLRSKFAGLLQVTVHSASGLPAADWWPGAKSDPYAVVSVGDSAAATSAVAQTLEPRWEETFYLYVRDLASQRLTLRVQDEDVGKADDLLGTAMRGLQDLENGDAQEVEVPLRGAKGPAGSVKLGLRFLPFDDEVLAEEATANQMGGPVLGSPPAAIMGSEWRSLQRDVLNAAADAMFDPVAFVENRESDTQAWLFWNPSTREACVAFRGTEQTKWKDIITDLKLVPTSIDPEGVGDTGATWLRRAPAAAAAAEPGPSLEAAVAALQSKRQELRSSVADGLKGLFAQQQEQQAQQPGGGDDGGEPVWVHEGFTQAYASVRGVVLRLLDALLAGEEEPWTLYLTGHSLGGALSTLCAYDCGRRSWRTAAHKPRLVHYNYGSPRVGNRAFAEGFDRLVPNAWRIANSNDAVALVPRMLGYCHIGHKVLLKPDGEAELERNSAQGVGEGAAMADVALAAAVNLPVLAEQMLGEAAEGGSGGGDGDGGKAALVSAAGVVAAAASALAGTAAAGEAAADAATGEALTSAADVQTLLEAEVQAMQRLLDGTAIDDHLEPLYLANLSAAVSRLRAERGGGGGTSQA